MTRELGLRRARAATLLMLGLPGSAYVYQGEELGLPDVTDLPDEVRAGPLLPPRGRPGRLPRRLSGADPVVGHAGAVRLRAGGGRPSWLPQPDSWAGLSVEAQTGVDGSTLELYRSALATRRAHASLRGGELAWLDAPAGVLAFRRTCGAGAPVVVTANATGEHVRMDLPGELLLASSSVEVEDGQAVLPPDTTAWWAC